MEITKTITTLSQVSFPVYRLTNRKPLSSEGVLYYSNSYLEVDSNPVSTNIKLIDNLAEPGETLSQRRLRMSAQEVPLYPLRVAIYFLGDFIKLAKKGWWFIDSTGKIFTYTKSLSVKLKFYKVKKVIRLDGTKCVLENEAWVLVRFSGTEPVVRFYAEARDEATLKKLCAEGEAFVKGTS